jgi:hypothetical protein
VATTGVPADSTSVTVVSVGDAPGGWAGDALPTGDAVPMGVVVGADVGTAVAVGTRVNVGDGSRVGLLGTTIRVVAVGAGLGVWVGVEGTGVGAIRLRPILDGSVLTSVMPCGTVT